MRPGTPPALPFDIEAIERELARLWQSAPPSDRPNELALSRTSVLTLFVYAPDSSRAEQARDLISRLSTYHPSRVVLLVAGQGQPSEEPSISIQCNLGIAERYAPCYEQIAIRLPSDGLELLPSLLIPLALSDLPAFLWWLGPLPCHDRRFIAVARAVDRLIFDSLLSEHPLTDLIATRRLLQHVARTGTAISDLNWARLGPWQETTARMFDITHCRWALEAITHVRLRYGHAPDRSTPNPTQALLYLGWLASRLGWRVANSERRGLGWHLDLVTPGNRHLTWSIAPESSEERFHGQLLHASFTAEQELELTTFAIELSGQDRATLRLRVQDASHCLLEHAFHHHLLDLQRLLVNELQETTPDWLYEHALDEATALAIELRKLQPAKER
ncbi:MAG: glucose-6-phosphate dehydrogenase assembly protein OpcA [Thermomicrobium sp.]|nr:glucose-6-phosphate dehydrogenase assembly protein OpcA [Thermomicrobium sp.]